MAEADVLCSRIAIISHGRLQSIGSPAHLKSKFGSGYNLRITLDPNYSSDQVVNISNLIPNSVLSQSYNASLEFTIADQNTNLGELYAILTQNSEHCGILEFSIHPTSLEQVFINLAHEEETKG